jgi:hypothetical protein
MELIKNADKMFTTPPKTILFAYGIMQQAFKDLKDGQSNIIFHEGIPSEEFMDEQLDLSEHNFLVLDDLIQEIASSKDACNIFTRTMHHKNISVAILYQNLFFQSKYMRTISLNLSYFVLMRSFRDRQQIGVLAKQCFAEDSKRMMEAYDDCTKHQRGYLVICNLPTVEEEDRLATSIFPQNTLTLYIKK